MLDLQLSLDEHLSNAVDERFIVDNEQKVAWVLKKLAHIKSKMQMNTDIANLEIERIRGWEKRQNDQLNNDYTYFSNLLQEYAMNQREKDPEFKKLDLPYGKLLFKKQQPEFKRNEVEILTWAKTNKPELIEVKESLKWAELKKAIKVDSGKCISEDGEVIPGIEVIEREDKFSVEV